MTRAPRLTGPYETHELAELSHPVTVAVAWEPIASFEEPFREALDDLAHAAQRSTGSLGVALLEPGAGGGEYHLIARFDSALSLRSWEESAERSAAMAELTPWVQDVNVATTHSPAAFFDALVGSRATPVARRWFIDVLWFTPCSLLTALTLGAVDTPWPLALRVFAGGLMVSGLYALVASPWRSHLEGRRNQERPLR